MKLSDHICGVASLVLCFREVFAQRSNPQEASAQGRPWRVGQPVKTTSGIVIGHPARNRTQVSEYLGIKFAREPVGQLRFAAPQPFFSNDTYIASAYVRSTPTFNWRRLTML
jgi:Carboxylesterase family